MKFPLYDYHCHYTYIHTHARRTHTYIHIYTHVIPGTVATMICFVIFAKHKRGLQHFICMYLDIEAVLVFCGAKNRKST